MHGKCVNDNGTFHCECNSPLITGDLCEKGKMFVNNVLNSSKIYQRLMRCKDGVNNVTIKAKQSISKNGDLTNSVGTTRF